MGFLDLHSVLIASAVSTRLHKCILSSLRSIRLYRPTTAACSLLSAYLAKHGQHVSSLQLLCSRYIEGHSALGRADVLAGDLQELPAMPSLQHLELQHLAVGDGVFQAVATCTQLTQLSINECRLAGKADITASDLGGLHHLQRLQLTGCTLHPEFGAVLSVLVKLTHLTLGCDRYCQEMSLGPVFDHITCATDLRELRLPSIVTWQPTPSSFWSLAGLQQLSSLQVDAVVPVNSGIPSSLQHLDICVGEVDPALLASDLQLKHLELRFADRCSSSSAAAQASEALLVKLADQKHLTFLKLEAPIIACSAAAYAALTVSSQLQHLELVNSDYGQPWRDILPHVFPVSHSLPELRYVALLQPRGQSAMAHASADEGVRPASDLELLAGIVSCCPSLQHLDIAEAMFRQGPLHPLLHVPHLTALRVSSISDRDAARVVAQLSKLQRLEITRGYRDGRITPAGLQHLTALHHLTFLRLRGDECSSGWSNEEEYRERYKQPSIFSDEESGEGASEAPSESSDHAADSQGLPTQSTDAQRRGGPGPASGSHSSLPYSGSPAESEPGDGLSPNREQSSGSCSDADCSESGLSSSSGNEPSSGSLGRRSSKLQASECRLSDACLATIAQITSLRELHLINHVDLTDAGMLELTALRQLTWLEVRGPEGLLKYDSECSIVRSPTNVSMRLLPALNSGCCAGCCHVCWRL